MQVVIAPDSFKGSMSQVDISETIARAIYDVCPDTLCILKPMADGGDGLLQACRRAQSDLNVQSRRFTGPRGNKRTCQIGFTADGTAIIEMAAIAGLDLVPESMRNPAEMTTFGIGEAIRCALNQHVEEIIIGLGGSATNDGGIGMLQALGATIQLREKQAAPERPLCGKDLPLIEEVDLSTIDSRVGQTRIRIASDVSNPLCGSSGATYIFGTQKGTNIEDLSLIDAQMANYVDTIIGVGGRSIKEVAHEPGAGAAGGLGFALLLLRGTMEQGAHVVGDIIELDAAIKQADFVITGEGKTDAQTAHGKAPYYVASRAKHFGVPAILLSGSIEYADWMEAYFYQSHALVTGRISVQQAMHETQARLHDKVQTIFRRMKK